MSIFMRAVIRAHSQQHRLSFVCDSFHGLPPSTLEADTNTSWDNTPYLEVSTDRVMSNFEMLGLSDPNVVFVKGLFSATMRPLRALHPEMELGGKFALLRLDGDMYESTVVCAIKKDAILCFEAVRIVGRQLQCVAAIAVSIAVAVALAVRGLICYGAYNSGSRCQFYDVVVATMLLCISDSSPNLSSPMSCLLMFTHSSALHLHRPSPGCALQFL